MAGIPLSVACVKAAQMTKEQTSGEEDRLSSNSPRKEIARRLLLKVSIQTLIARALSICMDWCRNNHFRALVTYH
jgi:hypothetical protein